MVCVPSLSEASSPPTDVLKDDCLRGAASTGVGAAGQCDTDHRPGTAASQASQALSVTSVKSPASVAHPHPPDKRLSYTMGLKTGGGGGDRKPQPRTTLRRRTLVSSHGNNMMFLTEGERVVGD